MEKLLSKDVISARNYFQTDPQELLCVNCPIELVLPSGKRAGFLQSHVIQLLAVGCLPTPEEMEERIISRGGSSPP